MDKDKIIAEQSAKIAQLEQLLHAALQRIVDLEARLKGNSGNSSKPPSSDGLAKKPAFPRLSGGKRGGKPGHGGKTLEMVATGEVDAVEVHPVLASSCACGHDLSGVAGELTGERRQVFDLPVKLLAVTEHRVSSKCCPGCGAEHRGSFPREAVSPVQYGPRVHALLGLLNVEQNMPIGRVCELFHSLTGHGLNENTVCSSVARTYELLEDDEALIKERVLSSPVAHADETGARVAGKLHWVHDLVTGMYTYLFVHGNRGALALESDASIAKDYRGTLVHDCWGSYFNLGDVRHALCGAHLLRELRGLVEGYGRCWASRMHDLLMYAYTFSEGGKGILPPDKYKIVLAQYKAILAGAEKEEPPATKPGGKGRPAKSKGRNLLERLEKYRDDVLRFAVETEVPFTNNLAERDIRPLKTKLKVSGCFRTFKGTEHYLRIKSFCSTAKKHGLSAYDELLNAMRGQSFLRGGVQPT